MNELENMYCVCYMALPAELPSHVTMLYNQQNIPLETVGNRSSTSSVSHPSTREILRCCQFPLVVKSTGCRKYPILQSRRCRCSYDQGCLAASMMLSRVGEKCERRRDRAEAIDARSAIGESSTTPPPRGVVPCGRDSLSSVVIGLSAGHHHRS